MKITTLEVDGYGLWTGLKLEDLSEGLNVFYGPNEAGKTTLMQFIRSVLYGFSDDRRCYLAPVRGGGHRGGSVVAGGSLNLTGPHGSYRLSRHQNPNPKHTGDGDLISLIGDDGTRQGEHLLKTLLSGVDEKIFNNVFAVGLVELQELGTLSDTEAAAQLYNLSVGLDRVSVVEVLRELDAARRRLLDPDGGAGQIVQLLGQRDKLHEELATLGAATGRYASLVAEHQQAERELRRLEDENARLHAELRTVESAIAVRDRWRQSAELARRLDALNAAESMPDGAIRQLESINAKLRRHHDRVRRLRHRRGEIRNEAAGLRINEALWRLAPRIEALGEQEDWIASLGRRAAELETEIGRLETELGAEKARLGLADSKIDGRLPALSSGLLAELRRPARQLRQANERVQDADREVAALRETARQMSDRIESALAAKGLHQDELATAMASAGDLVAQLRRRTQLDQRLDQMARHQAELETQSRELLGGQLLPAWVLIGVGGVFVVGVLLLMAGLFMPQSIIGSLGWPLALLGVVGTLAAVASKVAIERSNVAKLNACQRQVAMLQAQTKQTKEDRRQLDSRLQARGSTVRAEEPPEGGAANQPCLEAAERELAALEELVPLDARRQAAEQEALAAGHRAAEARSEMATRTDRWRQTLRKAGLPEGLSPKQLREVTARGSQIGQLQRQLELRYEEFQQRTRELDGLTGRIAQLASDAGLTIEEENPLEQLRNIRARLEEQEGWMSRRQELRSRARQLRRKLGKIDVAASRLKHLRRKLFRAAGVQSEEHLRRLADEAARAAALRAQLDALEREIDAAIGGHTTRAAVAKELDQDRQEPLSARLEQIRKRTQAGEAGFRGELEKRGRLGEQLKALAEDGTPAVKQLELAMVQHRLGEAVHDWRKLAVAARILDGIRASYERDRQPPALEEASTYLESLTQGRYVRVWTPLGEDVLLLEDAQGESLPVEVLSRGTREQLFLCLRLALANSYARRGAALPLVLDDVLVNFDCRRAKTAAAVLRDFAAAGHQLLVFTCHEHIVKLFKSLRVDVSSLPDNTQTGVTVAVTQGTPKSKGKPKAEPEVQPREPVRKRPAATIEPAVEAGDELDEDPPELDGDDEKIVPWEDEIEAHEVLIDEKDIEEDVEEDEYDEEDEEEIDDDDYEEDKYEYEEEEDEELSENEEGYEEEEDYEEDYDEEADELEEVADDEEDYEEPDRYEDEEDDLWPGGEDPEDDGGRRGYRDGWDDRYEDEYDREEDGPDEDHLDDAEAA